MCRFKRRQRHIDAPDWLSGAGDSNPAQKRKPRHSFLTWPTCCLLQCCLSPNFTTLICAGLVGCATSRHFKVLWIYCILRFLGRIAFAEQEIPAIPTHFSVSWSVCLSHSCSLLKPFGRFRCHLASTFVRSNDTFIGWRKRRFWSWTLGQNMQVLPPYEKKYDLWFTSIAASVNDSAFCRITFVLVWDLLSRLL